MDNTKKTLILKIEVPTRFFCDDCCSLIENKAFHGENKCVIFNCTLGYDKNGILKSPMCIEQSREKEN